MVTEAVISAGHFGSIDVERCLICGELFDEVIIHNRLHGVVLYKDLRDRKKVISA